MKICPPSSMRLIILLYNEPKRLVDETILKAIEICLTLTHTKVGTRSIAQICIDRPLR